MRVSILAKNCKFAQQYCSLNKKQEDIEASCTENCC